MANLTIWRVLRFSSEDLVGNEERLRRLVPKSYQPAEIRLTQAVTIIDQRTISTVIALIDMVAPEVVELVDHMCIDAATLALLVSCYKRDDLSFIEWERQGGEWVPVELNFNVTVEFGATPFIPES